MKKIFLSTIFVLAQSFLFSQNIIWEKTFSQAKWNNNRIWSISNAAGGGYISCGEYMGENNRFYWVMKFNVNGNIEWERTFEATDDDFPGKILRTKDDGYILAGRLGCNALLNLCDLHLLKLNKDGNKIWEKTYKGCANNFVNDVVELSTGGYLVCGGCSYSKIQYAWIIKLSETGEIIWKKDIENFGPCTSIIEDKKGDYIACLSTTYIIEIENKAKIIMMSPAGTIKFEKNLEYPKEFFCQSIQILQTSDEGSILKYVLVDDMDKPKKIIVNKYDINKNLLWTKTIHESNSKDGLIDITNTQLLQNSTGDYLSVINCIDKIPTKMLLYKIDANGSFSASKTLFLNQKEIYNASLLLNPDGSLIIGGYSLGYSFLLNVK